MNYKIEAKKVFGVMVYPLVFLVLLYLAKNIFFALEIDFLRWSLEYALGLVAFFLLASVSVLKFEDRHFYYTLFATLGLSIINYPMSELIRILILGGTPHIQFMYYLGDIIISLLVTLIFSYTLYAIYSRNIAKKLKPKRRR